MVQDSRTLEEIFNANYSLETLENPVKIIEAIGYIKALQEFVPHEKWLQPTKESLIDLLINKYNIFVKE